jgi:hypothetical protein
MAPIAPPSAVAPTVDAKRRPSGTLRSAVKPANGRSTAPNGAPTDPATNQTLGSKAARIPSMTMIQIVAPSAPAAAPARAPPPMRPTDTTMTRTALT